VSLDTSPFCVFPKRALDPKLKDFATIS